MGDRRERSAFGGFFTFLKFIFACTPHSCVLFLKCSKLTLYNVFSPVIWFLCRQGWMDEPSPRGNTGGVYGEDGVEQAGRVSESD